MATIAVFNQKGGVGKTTTALNLLAGIAQAGVRPLGLDLDPQAHLSHVFGVQPRLADDSVYSFFVRQRPLADVAVITRSGVPICPGHLELAKLDSLLGKGVNVVTRLRSALHGSGRPEGPVVIDCCPLLNVLSLNAVFACDLLLVPVSADFLALQGAKAGGPRAGRARAGVQAPAAAALPADPLRRPPPHERRSGDPDGRDAATRGDLRDTHSRKA